MTTHSVRYTNGEEDLILTMPWGLHSGRIPPPVIEFHNYCEFVYGGDAPPQQLHVEIVADLRAAMEQIVGELRDEWGNLIDDDYIDATADGENVIMLKMTMYELWEALKALKG